MQQARCFYAFILLVVIFWIFTFQLGYFDQLVVTPLKSLPAAFPVDAFDASAWYSAANETDNTTLPCPTEPIVMGKDGGTGLANKMWEYAMTWTLMKILDRPGYVSKSLIDILTPIFPNIGLPILEDLDHCNLTDAIVLKTHTDVKHAKETYKGKHVKIPPYDMLPSVLLPYLDELRDKVFVFNDDILRKVNKTISSFNAENRTIVAIHVRRTDYIDLLVHLYKISPAHSSFYLDAMEWFRKNIGGDLLFMIQTDDVKWCEENLLEKKDVVIASEDYLHDLALLSLADHNIIDYGSYGMWAGLMIKGHTIALIDIDFNGMITKYRDWHLFDESKYTSRVEFE